MKFNFYIIILGIVTFNLSLNAWIKVKNDTDEKIKVVLDLVSCPDKDYVLNAGETEKLYSGLGKTDFCAIRGFKVYRKIKGDWKEQKVYQGSLDEVDLAVMSMVAAGTIIGAPFIAIRTTGDKGSFVIKKSSDGKFYVAVLKSAII